MIVWDMSNNNIREITCCDICGKEISKESLCASPDGKKHFCVKCLMQNDYMERRNIDVQEEDV